MNSEEIELEYISPEQTGQMNCSLSYDTNFFLGGGGP